MCLCVRACTYTHISLWNSFPYEYSSLISPRRNQIDFHYHGLLNYHRPLLKNFLYFLFLHTHRDASVLTGELPKRNWSGIWSVSFPSRGLLPWYISNWNLSGIFVFCFEFHRFFDSYSLAWHSLLFDDFITARLKKARARGKNVMLDLHCVIMDFVCLFAAG